MDPLTPIQVSLLLHKVGAPNGTFNVHRDHIGLQPIKDGEGLGGGGGVTNEKLATIAPARKDSHAATTRTIDVKVVGTLQVRTEAT